MRMVGKCPVCHAPNKELKIFKNEIQLKARLMRVDKICDTCLSEETKYRKYHMENTGAKKRGGNVGG
jgi:C4-type Zn-finger protein